MAKQANMYPEPWRKRMVPFWDFSGGLNTVTANDNLRNNELRDVSNVDLADNGTPQRRYGQVVHLAVPAGASGKAQGYFRYYKADGTYDEFQAIGGVLYRNGTALAITGLAGGFQTTRPIEAAQMKDKMYFATGTKLVVYDGTTASVVTPYSPNALENLYIGTNGLLDNPDASVSDGTGTVLTLEGATVNKRYGIVNQATTFTAYVMKPAAMIVEYQFEYRKAGDTAAMTVGQAWSTTKTWAFTPTAVQDYEVKVSARDQANTATVSQWFLPKYTVKQTDENVPVNSSTLQTCNRIFLYWDRLVMYGDTSQQGMMYVSHLNRGDYFPLTNTEDFTDSEKSGLTKMQPYRDFVVAFTNNSIKAMFGKFPAEFTFVTLSTGIGCVAPDSVSTFGNYLAFKSQYGIRILKRVAYSQDESNTQAIDIKIGNIVPTDTDACGIYHMGQYMICFPQQQKRFRFYENFGSWTKDDSTKMNFARMYDFDGILYGQDQNGEVRNFDPTVWDDAGYVYTDSVETKYFDFELPYNLKKLKEIQVLMGSKSSTNCSLSVYADSALVLSPDSSYASVVNGNVVWNVQDTPNIHIDAGTTLGSWEMGTSPFGNPQSQIYKLQISGKCRRTRLKIIHTEATPNQMLGFGYIFKVKKP